MNFKTRKKTIKFLEPCIYDALTFTQIIKDSENLDDPTDQEFKAVQLITKDIDKMEFWWNKHIVLPAISSLIYNLKNEVTNTKKNTTDDDSEWSDWFLPASIDQMAHRYWVLPKTLMKEVTFTQLMTFSRGYEWNINIQTKEERKNIRILMEFAEDPVWDNEKVLEQLKKDRELFRKMWRSPDID